MKIFLIILIVIIAIITGTAIVFTRLAAQSEDAYAQLLAGKVSEPDLSVLDDGEFRGAYRVFPVNVELEVGILDNKIQSIEIIKHINGQGGPAEAIVDKIIDKQSLQVDTVTGATFSSLVILKAVEDALIPNQN